MFVCCPEKEAKKRMRKLGDLKNLVETIGEKMAIPCSLVCCPKCCPNNNNDQEPSKEPAMPPDIMVCYKTEKIEKKKNGKTTKRNKVKRVKRSKSRELRASILYQGCDCEKRNGLQDDCQRTGCQGSPECMTQPEPTCGPSEFSNGKHLGKKFAGTEQKGGNGENGDEEGNGKVTVYYNCYPATVKCTEKQ